MKQLARALDRALTLAAYALVAVAVFTYGVCWWVTLRN